MYWVAENGNWETVEGLLDRGALANVKSKDEKASKPIDWPLWDYLHDSWGNDRTNKLRQRLEEVSE